MHTRARIRNQRGLTLAEIGMAIFAIGIGALSIATVYLQRERTASITAQHATARDLAVEMTARIDAQQKPDARYENAIGVRCSAAQQNTNAQTATTNEVACWQERVAAQLPNGSGSIAFDSSMVPATYVVTVSWSQPRGGLASYTVRATAHIAPSPSSPPPTTAAPRDSKPNATRAAN
jgi:Tfp pilus assembly protein PilV